MMMTDSDSIEMVWGLATLLLSVMTMTMTVAGDLLRSSRAGSRPVGIRRKVNATDLRSSPVCPACANRFRLNELKVSVLNRMPDGSRISGTVETRWVHLDCAVEMGLAPARRPNRNSAVKVWMDLMDYALKVDVSKYVGGSDPKPEPQPTPKNEEPKEPAPSPAASGSMEGMIASMLMPTIEANFGDLLATHKAAVMQMVSDKVSTLTLPRELIVKTVKPLKDVKMGMTHGKFDRLLRDVTTFSEKDIRLNSILVGPAGSGKTFAARQLFKLLCEIGQANGGFANPTSAVYAEISCHGEMMPSDIIGPNIPNIGASGDGASFDYCPTEAIGAYENGGVVMADEFDRLLTGTATAFNAAIAGKTWTLPDGRQISRHPDFIFIGTANTFGNGRDRKYSAAQKIDAATLDRFSGSAIRWGYCPSLEAKLCPDPDLREAIVTYRKAMINAGIDRIISPRMMMSAWAKVSQHDLSHREALMECFESWSESDLRTIGFPNDDIQTLVGGAV